jgi:ABC-type cobalamin/Fe3+-siderophores transport system ATPase subunit
MMRGGGTSSWTDRVQQGDADQCIVALQHFRIMGGQEIELPAAGVTAIVGANNSGKSTLLRQLQWSITHPQNIDSDSVRLVDSVSLRKEGTANDLISWLMQHAAYRADPQGNHGYFSRPEAGNLDISRAYALWQGGLQNQLSELGPYFIRYADAQSRLAQTAGAGHRGDVGEPPNHPLHALQDDARLRHKLDDISQRIFRQRLTLDDLSGNIRLRVGRPSVAAPGPDDSQGAYRKSLADLPPLEAQGDGMKSLLGLLLPLIAATYSVVIVDEPEAFLHPPQAYALGSVLGELARDSKVQVVLATHDRNLLAGLLDSDAPLTVVRLTREFNSTSAAQLAPEKLRNIWSEPVLRYSNVLDGLFHQLVVLGEAERDCRFYAAALDSAQDASGLVIPPSDVLFVPSNGKAGMARLAEALRAVAVPVVASPDLDILNDRTVLARLVTALGGNWDESNAHYEVATRPFRDSRERARIGEIRDAVNDVLDRVERDDPEGRYSSGVRERILTALRTKESPWQALKDYGDRAFKGESAKAAVELFEDLDKQGVVTVKYGELEGFAPAIGLAKGKAWLSAALDAGAHQQTEAQSHISRILSAYTAVTSRKPEQP